MGSGSWDTRSFVSYSTSKGYGTDSRGVVTGSYSNQEMFKAKNIDAALDPKGVIRECCDNEEHPNTLPVILALDVTGSMGQTAVEIAKRLNEIMTKLYGQIKDVEFMIMGIGDLAYDNYPIQASQFESDIRIAEQLDKIYFESQTYLEGKEKVLEGLEKGIMYRKEDGSVWADLTAEGLDHK